MAMYLTRQPMTKGQFDAILAGIGWRREKAEACDPTQPRHAFISDIDKVPGADGGRRILFEGHRVSDCRDLFGAVECMDDGDPVFWETLGIDVEMEDGPEAVN